MAELWSSTRPKSVSRSAGVSVTTSGAVPRPARAASDSRIEGPSGAMPSRARRSCTAAIDSGPPEMRVVDAVSVSIGPVPGNDATSELPPWSTAKIWMAGMSGRNPLSRTTPLADGGPTRGPNVATRRRPGEPVSVCWASRGRADRDVSGSRSARRTTKSMPWPARVAARPGEGRPAAMSRCTESMARMAPGGVSGMASRTAHGVVESGWSGSSRVSPQS